MTLIFTLFGLAAVPHYSLNGLFNWNTIGGICFNNLKILDISNQLLMSCPAILTIYKVKPLSYQTSSPLYVPQMHRDTWFCTTNIFSTTMRPSCSRKRAEVLLGQTFIIMFSIFGCMLNIDALFSSISCIELYSNTVLMSLAQINQEKYLVLD